MKSFKWFCVALMGGILFWGLNLKSKNQFLISDSKNTVKSESVIPLGLSSVRSSQQESLVNAGIPVLAWSKSFKERITSAIISKDGSIIAVADESGFLYYFDIDGRELWKFDYRKPIPEDKQVFKLDRAWTIMSDIELSDDNKHIACTLNGLTTWIDEAGDKQYGYGPRRIIYIDARNGKLLWEFNAMGKPVISDSGKYILTLPPKDDENEPDDKYYFLNNEGKRLWSQDAKGYPVGGFKNEKYVFTDTVIYDLNGSPVWVLNKKEFFQLAYKNFVLIKKFVDADPTASIGQSVPAKIKFAVHDFESKQILWETNIYSTYRTYHTPLDAQNTRDFGWHAVSDNYIMLTCNGKLRIFDINTGTELQGYDYDIYPFMCAKIAGNGKYILLAGEANQGVFLVLLEKNKLPKWRMRLSDATRLYLHVSSTEDVKHILVADGTRLDLYDNAKYVMRSDLN